MHAGGFGDLMDGMGFQRALAILRHENEINIETLTVVNNALTAFIKPLSTHHPSWKSGFRVDDEIYYYPACPRGFPLSSLHRFVFLDDKKKIEKYDKLFEKDKKDKKTKNDEDRVTWFKLMEAGSVSLDDKKELFRVVRSDLNGTASEFVAAWKKFQEENPYGTLDPILYVVGLHDLIVQFSPFIRANRLTARLVLCHHLGNLNQIAPPVFWSASMYERKINAYPALAAKKMVETADSKVKTQFDMKRRSFINWIVGLIYEGSWVINKKNPEHARPYEVWEIDAINEKFKEALLGLFQCCKRMLFAELVVAMSSYVDSGKEILYADGTNGEWLWLGFSKQILTPLTELINEGRLKVVNTHPNEYIKRRFRPFSKEIPKGFWRPAALVFVK